MLGRVQSDARTTWAACESRVRSVARLTVLLLVAISLPLAACGDASKPTPSPPRQLSDSSQARLAEAERLMLNGRNELVETLLTPLLEASPPVPQAQVLAGWAAYQLDDYGRCVELMSAGIERMPSDWWRGWAGRRVHAFALYKRGEYERAAAAFRVALASPVEPAIDPSRGESESQVASWRAQQQAAVDKELSRMHYGLGLCELTLERLAPARAHLSAALELDADYLKAQHAWSELLAAEDQVEEALAANAKLLAAWPTHEEALNLRAQLLARAGREADAEVAYARWREVYDGRAAIGTLQRSVKEGTDTPETWLQIAELYLQLLDHREFHRALELGKLRHPDSPLFDERLEAFLRDNGLFGSTGPEQG
ncbi:MAG: hypothetical protein DHS20C15_02720 [Planctomycetota bacterium]|nr:MAG: hypothetical protein DHS20C15_02720 [Planctomycetota bacterium]